MTEHQEDWINAEQETAQEKPSRPQFAPGIHEGISNADYHASEGVSNSLLKLIVDKTPAHAVAPRRWESTRAQEIGTAIHCAILEPKRFDADYKVIECDDRRSALYKAACRDHPSDQVLTIAEAGNVIGMRDSAYANGAAGHALSLPGRYELSVFAKDPVTGLLVKCRFDKKPDAPFGLDVKKTQDARLDHCERAMMNYLYHMQAAFYMDVWEWATGEKLDSFKLLWIEEKAPHACKLRRVNDEAIEEGRRLYRTALNIYADCVATGDWFAYGDEEEEMGLPAWAISQMEDELEVNLDE